jgi:hypothetical protein
VMMRKIGCCQGLEERGMRSADNGGVFLWREDKPVLHLGMVHAAFRGGRHLCEYP